MGEFLGTMAIALATFLWYRKGRLWNFYDALTEESVKQITTNSIDREKWESLAIAQCRLLAKQTFSSLFRFELEYLIKKVEENQLGMWIADSESIPIKNGLLNVVYTNKAKFARSYVRKIFYRDLQFCGFWLFVHGLDWKLSQKEDKDMGVEMKVHKFDK